MRRGVAGASYEGAAHAWRWLAGAAALISIALLAHYDGIFAIPALVWLVGMGGRQRGWGAMLLLRATWPALLIGLLLVGGFYVPFVLHEHFSGTVAYLTWQVDADAAIEAGDRVVVVVGDDETMGVPLCDDTPPSSWGHTTATHTAFTVPASGTIRVGVRHSNGTMMPVVGGGEWVVVR